MRLMTSVVHVTIVILLLAHWGSTKEDKIIKKKNESDSDNVVLSTQEKVSFDFQQGLKAVQVAYYATIAGGIELNELSIKVSRLALDMKRLHTKYIVMIAKHKAHFKSILNMMSLIHEEFHMQALKILEFTEDDFTGISQSAADLCHDLKAVIDQCFHQCREAMRLQESYINSNEGDAKHVIDALENAILALMHVERNMQDMDNYWTIRAKEIEILRYVARDFQELIMDIEEDDFKVLLNIKHFAEMMDDNTHILEDEMQKYAQLEKQIEREHQSFEIGGNFVRKHSQEEALIEVGKLTDELIVIGHDEDQGTRKVQHTEL